MASQTDNLKDVVAALHTLENRVAAVETALKDDRRRAVNESDPEDRELPLSPGSANSEEDQLEYQIGELWVGQVGVGLLLIGLAFLITYPFAQVWAPAAQAGIGYLAVAVIYAASKRIQSAYASISRVLFTGCVLLLYFTTVHLHFSGSEPLVPSRQIGIFLLVAVHLLVLSSAYLRVSRHLLIVAVLLGTVTCCLVDSEPVFLFITVLSTAAVCYMCKLRSLPGLLSAAAVLIYLTHLIWLFGNPFGGGPLLLAATTSHTLVLLLTGLCLGVPGLLNDDWEDDGPGIIVHHIGLAGAFLVVSLMAGAGGAFMGSVAFLVTVCLLGLATGHWWRRESTFATAIYASAGYIALSIAIVATFDSPIRFVCLALQSLLVVSSAIWFGSRILVVANMFIYVGILLAYLALNESELMVNLAYAAVGMLSARIMNRQQERLRLRTDAMRNAYLATAFVIIPFGLLHGLPSSYVSLSWLATALVYFGISYYLDNRKYRWMAIGQIFVTVINVIVVDMARLEAVYRIITFVLIGVILMAVSGIYARQRVRMRASHSD